MEYIDKSHFLGREREIDRIFLEDCFDKDSLSFYPEIDTDQSYANFSNRTYRKGIDGWEHLLLQEQNDVTKFPHRIALTNLLASCNGKFGKPQDGCCCNNARSNDYLLPLMLMPEVDQRIKYDKHSGLIMLYPKEKSWEKMLQTLNDGTYKEIRVLWYKAWLHKDEFQLESLVHYDTKERILFLNLIFDVDNFTKISEEYQKYAGILTGDSVYWKLFLDFDWFYNYNWG